MLLGGGIGIKCARTGSRCAHIQPDQAERGTGVSVLCIVLCIVSCTEMCTSRCPFAWYVATFQRLTTCNVTLQDYLLPHQFENLGYQLENYVNRIMSSEYDAMTYMNMYSEVRDLMGEDLMVANFGYEDLKV